MARGKKAAAADAAETEVKPDTANASEPDDMFDNVTDDVGAGEIDLAVDTLTGDLRDSVLQMVRYEQDKRPWDERSEADQKLTISRVETNVRKLVMRAVELIASQGRRSIKATLESITAKDAIVGKIVLSKFDVQRHALLDATGSTVLIVVADPDHFDGERAPAQVKPDQGTLLGDAAVVVHSTAEDNHEAPFH